MGDDAVRKVIAAGAFLLLVAAAPAIAGDRHLVQPLGYSEDGRYFAFEEFGGEGDGSVAMSSISIIDVTTDTQTQGSPFAAEGKEGDSLAEVRRKAAAAAAAQLAALRISAPVQFVSMVGDGVAGANGLALRFGAPGSGYGAEVYGDRLLTLEVFETEDRNRPICEASGSRPKGFALAVAEAGIPREIYRDAKVPQSRGCVLDYRLYGVVLPYNQDLSKAVALVSVLTPGFEGYVRGFIAVPVGK
jgi:predicted secreted protein